MRLQLREELLNTENAPLANFLIKFLFRPEILKTIIDEALLASFPEDGSQISNPHTDSLLKCVHMLFEAGTLQQKASMYAYLPHLQSLLPAY